MGGFFGPVSENAQSVVSLQEVVLVVAWSVFVEEGEEHELVAVDIGSTFRLALQLQWQVEYCSDNVGNQVKRAEEPFVEEITLGGI